VVTAARWARFAALLPRAEADGVRLGTARGRIIIGTRAAVAKLLGGAPAAPAVAGYSLACAEPRAVVERCAAAGLPARRTAGGLAIALPPALGGVWVLRA